MKYKSIFLQEVKISSHMRRKQINQSAFWERREEEKQRYMHQVRICRTLSHKSRLLGGKGEKESTHDVLVPIPPVLFSMVTTTFRCPWCHSSDKRRESRFLSRDDFQGSSLHHTKWILLLHTSGHIDEYPCVFCAFFY